jgi:hypothetical protein
VHRLQSRPLLKLEAQQASVAGSEVAIRILAGRARLLRRMDYAGDTLPASQVVDHPLGRTPMTLYSRDGEREGEVRKLPMKGRAAIIAVVSD